MQNDQLAFIEHEQLSLLQKLETGTPAKWGVMNSQQMVEHVRAFFNVSTEKIKLELLTPEEHLPKYRDFLYSDKQFRENTKAPATLLGEEALPLRYPDLDTARLKYTQSVQNFFSYFKENKGKRTLHPVFGLLDFEEWIRLHYKHVTHHWRQFGLTEQK